MPKILEDGTRDWTDEWNDAMHEEDKWYSERRMYIRELKKQLKNGEITEKEYKQKLEVE